MPQKKTTESKPAKKKLAKKKVSSKQSSRSSLKKKSGRKKTSQKKPFGFWILLIKLCILAWFFGATGLAGLFWMYGRNLPSVEKLKSYKPPQTTRILDRNGKLIGELFEERRTVVPTEKIPKVLIYSVLAAEDADFYKHEGLDYPGIARAIARDVLAGRAAQGASTITQQVVKLLLLSPERTLSRKVKELILARRLEQELSKDEILHLYLNHINFGHGRYGVQEASMYYFGKNVENLSLAEASLIAGIPQRPSYLSPRKNFDAAKKRQSFILNQLERKYETHFHDLPLSRIRAAKKQKITLIPLPEKNRHGWEIKQIAKNTLRKTVGEEAFRKGGFTIFTTIDLEHQIQARKSLQEGLRTVDKRQKHQGPLSKKRKTKTKKSSSLRYGVTYPAVVKSADDETQTVFMEVGKQIVKVPVNDKNRYNPKELPTSKFAPQGSYAPISLVQIPNEKEKKEGHIPIGKLELGPQGAVVLLDPHTGEVLALVGAYEKSPGFNRAIQAKRQPGSTFKPIVYAYGIQTKQYTTSTLVMDAPVIYDEWKPSNYEPWNLRGAMRLREALALSVNLVAVRVMENLGPVSVAEFANKIGIQTKLQPTLALSLGASEVSPIELARAYATFANGGTKQPIQFITRIENSNGDIFPLPELEKPERVMDEASAFLITSMLSSVVQEGTARSAKKLGKAIAGKTGTSNQARDAWFAGYTPSTVAVVWVGFDDRRPLGKKEYGGRTALPIWIDLIGNIEKNSPHEEFPVPEGIRTAHIDPKSGRLAYQGMENAIVEYYMEGTAPTKTALPPDTLDSTNFLLDQFEQNTPGENNAPEMN